MQRPPSEAVFELAGQEPGRAPHGHVDPVGQEPLGHTGAQGDAEGLLGQARLGTGGVVVPGRRRRRCLRRPQGDEQLRVRRLGDRQVRLGHREARRWLLLPAADGDGDVLGIGVEQQAQGPVETRGGRAARSISSGSPTSAMLTRGSRRGRCRRQPAAGAAGRWSWGRPRRPPPGAAAGAAAPGPGRGRPAHGRPGRWRS